jgi:hypothetical protein
MREERRDEGRRQEERQPRARIERNEERREDLPARREVIGEAVEEPGRVQPEGRAEGPPLKPEEHRQRRRHRDPRERGGADPPLARAHEDDETHERRGQRRILAEPDAQPARNPAARAGRSRRRAHTHGRVRGPDGRR